MVWKWSRVLAVLLLPTAANAESRRLCDTRMEWEYEKPAPDVPAKLQNLLGLWAGAVSFSGSSESTRMCIAVAIHAVKANGQTLSTFVWHLGDGNESPNQVSFGTARWWAQTDVIFPDKGDQLIFAAIAPYRGKWFRYILDLPTQSDPDTLKGGLYATRQGSAVDQSPTVWTNTVEVHQVMLKRLKYSYLPFPVGGK
ncbi:hypothetical protein [Reyranella sp.]|uniref:hypothetical protein n=1 Tax=Reyranella sp. TaxID=1929291 RepID=UPI003D0F2528